MDNMKDFYSFNANDIDGLEVPMSRYKLVLSSLFIF